MALLYRQKTVNCLFTDVTITKVESDVSPEYHEKCQSQISLFLWKHIRFEINSHLPGSIQTVFATTHARLCRVTASCSLRRLQEQN
jgi:hypothetical protein